MTLFLILLALFAVLTTPAYLHSQKLVKKKDNDAEMRYAKEYDSIMYDPDTAELEREVLHSLITEEDIVLDVGCRTGRVVGALNADVMGVDDSKEMVAVAQTKYPFKVFRVGNVMKREEFRPETFTRVLCLGDRVYCFSEKLLFFQHCYYWLKPKGYLVVQAEPLRKRIQTQYKAKDKLYYESVSRIQGLAEMAMFTLAEESSKGGTTLLVFLKRDF